MDAASATLVLFNGVTGAVADVALNDLSRGTDFAKLRRYFERRSVLGAAGAAALTVMVGAIAVLCTTQLLFDYAEPTNLREVGLTIGVSFVIGCAMDVAIQKARVFGNDLEPYYAAHGAGLWGGASLVVSMAVSLAMQAYVLPHLA